MDILFENFVLDPARRAITKRGAEVMLEPQVFDLLVYLVRERTRVVSKDELVRDVWRGRVVSDSTIESRLSLLRKALGDDGHAQRLIRTYSRKGVRFIGEVWEETTPDRLSLIDQGQNIPVLSTACGDEHGRPRVAVMPFVNLSGDPEQEHAAEGISADIIALLVRYRSLFVISRNTSFALKGQQVGARQVGAWLGADYVVEGTFQRSRQQVRVTFELVETEQGCAMWSERYDHAAQDIFVVQDDIAEKIVACVEPEIGRWTRRKVARHPPQSMQAWEHFHLGLSRLYLATASDNLAAQDCFRRAIALDPTFSQAHAFLSYAVVLSMIYFGAQPDRERLDAALGDARRAVELDEHDSAARFALGRALTVNREYDDAIAEMELATQINPAQAIGWCGLADVHAYSGAFQTAFPLFQRAIDLGPRDPMLWAFFAYLSQAHLFAGDFELAESYARKAVRVPRCHHWPFAHRVAALGQLGRTQEALQACEQLLRLKPDFSCSWARERLFYLRDADQVHTYIEGLHLAGLPD